MGKENTKVDQADSVGLKGGSLSPGTESDQVRRHEDELLDEALKETFPASDPISITVRDVASSASPIKPDTLPTEVPHKE
jgi:hypothetical protein